jgi:zinc D-Ala-D-Ala carboxypeptidase
MLPSLRAVAVALVLGGAMVAVPAAAPPTALGVGPLPKCRLDDILTIPRDYDSWRTTLVDWLLSVGPDYKPPDLVSISKAGVTGGGQIRAVAFDDLQAMAGAARAHGTPLGNVSSYRSYKTQKALFNSYVDGYGFKRAITFSARPGHSEHQLGVTIDFAAAGTSTFVSETTPTGRWLSRNAWKYGWLMSYPKGKSDVVCYSYEPWHYRYYGRELAKAIHHSGLTTREYLWSHFTQVDVKTGSPVPSKSAEPSTTPTGQPSTSSPEPGGSPSPEAPSAGGATSPAVAPAPSGSPIQPVGTWFGLDPPVAIVGFVLILGSIGTLAALSLRRPARRR